MLDGVEKVNFDSGAESFHAIGDHANISHKFDLLVENCGRSNGGPAMNYARKGILEGDILLDGSIVENITIYSLDFNRTFVEHLGTLTKWTQVNATTVGNAPAMYRTHLK